jgi:hypothetical protein
VIRRKGPTGTRWVDLPATNKRGGRRRGQGGKLPKESLNRAQTRQNGLSCDFGISIHKRKVRLANPVQQILSCDGAWPIYESLESILH